MAESDPKKLTVEEQVARIKAAKEAAKKDAADKAAAAAVAASQSALAAQVPVPAAKVAAPVAPAVPVAPVVAAAPIPAPAPVAPAVAAGPAPAPGSVEEKVAQIKAAKAAAAEKMKTDAAKKAGGAAPAAATASAAPPAPAAPGSVEEKVAQIKAAKAAAAEKMKADAAAKAGGPALAAVVPTAPAAPPAPGSVEEKVAQIKAAKAAAAEKMKADVAAKAGTAPVGAGTIAVDTPSGPVAVPPGTPEALARAAAAHEKAQGATGINAHGTPANKPAVVLLAAAAAKKPGVATTAAKKKEPEGPLPPPPKQDRRVFLGFFTLGSGMWLIFWGWLAATGALFTRFMFPNVLYESDPKFSAGRKNDFPESPKVYEKYKQDQAVWIVRLTEEGQDRLVALSTVCTHLGCTPNWLEVEQKYKCPCHGSGYYLNGVNFEGPTPRPLERFRIFVDATGNIIVDKAKKYRQDLQQWNENQSYVSMS